MLKTKFASTIIVPLTLGTNEHWYKNIKMVFPTVHLSFSKQDRNPEEKDNLADPQHLPNQVVHIYPYNVKEQRFDPFLDTNERIGLLGAEVSKAQVLSSEAFMKQKSIGYR